MDSSGEVDKLELKPDTVLTDYEDQSVKEIICTGVLEFIAGNERGAFMDQCYRILADDGKMTVTVPYWNSWRAYYDARYEWPPFCEQSFLCYNKAWRDANLKGLELECDFDFCVSPETEVLRTDLRWMPASTIQVGDKIVAVNEYAKEPGDHRRFLEANVEFTRTFEHQRVRVVTDEIDVIVTPEHPFLARSNGQPYSWIRADRLNQNHFIKFIGKPWVDHRPDSWISGMMDGEGCIVLPKRKDRYTGVNLTISQRPGQVLDRVVDELSKDIGVERVSVYDKGIGSGDCKTICVSSISKTLRLVGIYRPIRLLEKIQTIIQSERLGLPDSRAKVLAVEQMSDGEVVAIRTSSRTLITNGLVSHNTYGYAWEAETVARNDESRAFWTKHYTNSVDALQLTFTKRAKG